jgi:hypothetical protein
MVLDNIDELIEDLEIQKDAEDYYLDAFNNRISFNGIRTIKPAFCKLSLTEAHIQELYKCSTDFIYFRENYCKIMTKTGYARPELRGYQQRFEQDLLNYKRNVILASRQSGKCCEKDTIITIRNKETGEVQEVTMMEFHNLSEE